MDKPRRGSQGRSAGVLDWDEIHRRMEAVREAIDHGWKPTLEEKAKLLCARAEALAREPARKDTSEQALEVVEFLLAHEHYGLELQYVREVYPLKDLTPLPGTPVFILGVTNVRGQVLAVVDIKKLFGLPDRGLTDLNKIIIIHTPEAELGVLADSVVGLCPVPVSEVQPSLPTLKGIREDFLRGITRKSMVLLDAQKLLSLRDTGRGERV